MDTTLARELAEQAMADYGLTEQGWRFEWSRGKRTFGDVTFGMQRLRLSKILTELNEEGQVLDTILHEIAHALAGRDAGHGPRWKACAKQVGATPERCDPTGEVAPPNYIGTCPSCGRTVKRYRMGKSTRSMSCGTCDKNYNPEFLFKWEKVGA